MNPPTDSHGLPLSDVRQLPPAHRIAWPSVRVAAMKRKVATALVRLPHARTSR